MGKADDFMKDLSNSYLGNRSHDLEVLINVCEAKGIFDSKGMEQVQMYLKMLKDLFDLEISSRKGVSNG
jgi:hypothetical protein